MKKTNSHIIFPRLKKERYVEEIIKDNNKLEKVAVEHNAGKIKEYFISTVIILTLLVTILSFLLFIWFSIRDNSEQATNFLDILKLTFPALLFYFFGYNKN